MDSAIWAAGGSATVVGLSSYWWYRLRRVETQAERLMHRIRAEIGVLADERPVP